MKINITNNQKELMTRIANKSVQRIMGESSKAIISREAGFSTHGCVISKKNDTFKLSSKEFKNNVAAEVIYNNE